MSEEKTEELIVLKNIGQRKIVYGSDFENDVLHPGKSKKFPKAIAENLKRLMGEELLDPNDKTIIDDAEVANIPSHAGAGKTVDDAHGEVIEGDEAEVHDEVKPKRGRKSKDEAAE